MTDHGAPADGPGADDVTTGALPHLVADALPALVCYVDAGQRYRFANRTYEAWFGHPRDEIIGRTVREVVGEAAYERLRPHVEAALAGRAVAFEGLVPYRHGGPRHVEARYEPHAAPDGRVLGYYALMTDVTARARAEAGLREARARAEALAAERAAVLGQLAEGVIVTDRAGRITLVNDAAARLHGVAKLDVPPEAYSETYHLFTEDGRPYPPEELPLARAVLRGETVADARWRIRRPDGTEVLAIGSARPLLAPGGEAIGAVLTLRDDTAREAAERRLRESEARFRTVVEDQTEFISRLAPDLTITFLNGAYAKQLGRPREDLLGTSMLDLMNEAQRARFTAQLAALTPEAPIVAYEMDTVLPDGTPGWEHWTDRALFDARGRLVEYQSVGRDITAAKAALAQRELLLAELSHRVKNTLAVVQGIASRSLTPGRAPEEARGVFTRRLRALAKAHSLLTASEWRGASLRTIVESELRPYGDRAAVAGERDIALGPRAALTVSLVLHELATNAAKHGALRAPEGRVEVAWRRDGPAALRLTWREAGGPPVTAPGERRGFGRTLIERAAAHELEGEARLEFLPGGASYELRAPLARLTASG